MNNNQESFLGDLKKLLNKYNIKRMMAYGEPHGILFVSDDGNLSVFEYSEEKYWVVETQVAEYKP